MTSGTAPRCALLTAFALVAAGPAVQGHRPAEDAVARFDFLQVGTEVQIH